MAGEQDVISDSADLPEQGPLSDCNHGSRTSTVDSWSEKLKPSFTQKLKYRSVLVGEPVVFQCKLSAYPVPQITWFHNNRQIPQSLRRIIQTESCLDMHNSSLEVKEVQERDSGSYKVFAINSEGSDESTASLLVAHGEGQNAKNLEFLRKKSERTREHIKRLVQNKKGDRLRVDLKCIGSPFDKKQETEKELTTSKGRVRTINFENNSSLKQTLVYDKDQIRNEYSVRGGSEAEVLLDEEIKMKLQRLRAAKKAVLEKKKMCLLQGPAEVQPASGRSVDFRDKRGVLVHPVCMASPIEKRESDFQTIEQINEKVMLPKMLDTEEITVGSSNRGLEKKKFQIRMDQIVGLSEPPQIAPKFADRSTEEKMFQAGKRTTFKGAMKKQVPEQGTPKLMDYTYDQIKSVETRMDNKPGELSEDFKITKSTKKNPSPLVYVLLNDDTTDTIKREVVMSDMITLNVNEPTAISESRETSKFQIKFVEISAAVKEHSVEMEGKGLAEVTESRTEKKETPVKLESPVPKYLKQCPPSFTHEIESQEINEGESCGFGCDFQGYPNPTATWYNNEKPLSHNQECIIYTTENHSTMTLPSVLRDQEGSITCVIFNQHGTATTSGTLKVKVKEKADSESVSICKVQLVPDYTEEEEELSLAFGNVKEAEEGISTRATLLLPQVNPPRPCSLDPGLLSLPVEIKITAPTPTPEQDVEFKEGIQCVEFVPEEPPEEPTLPGVKHKFKFSFDAVHEPPQIIKEIQHRIKCKEGDSVVLECIISGEPLPIVMWLHNDRLLIPTENVCFEEGDGIYRLHNSKVSMSDSGTYKCVAENKAGIVETVCDLSVDTMVELFDSNLEQTDLLKTIQDQAAGVQENIAKEYLENYFESSMGPIESNVTHKEYSVTQQFHNVSTVEFLEEQRSTEMEFQLPSYINNVMKSLLGDESITFQTQDNKETSKGMEPNVDKMQKVPIFSGILSDSPLVCTATEMSSMAEEQEFRSSSFDKEDILIREKKISRFGEEKEKEICCDERVLGKVEADMPELMFDFKEIHPAVDKVDANIQEQRETQQPLDLHPVADILSDILDEKPPYSNTDSFDKEQSRPKSEDVYVTQQRSVSETIKNDEKKITEMAQMTTFALAQDRCYDQDESDLLEQSLDTEIIVETQKEIIDKDLSGYEGILNTMEHSSLTPENVIFDLKQAFSVVENNIQPQETVQPEEIYFKHLYSISEGAQVDSHNITENVQNNVEPQMHSRQKASFSSEKDDVPKHACPDNEEINLKLAFLNIENVSQQQEGKLLQEEMPLKFLYSGPEGMEAFQGETTSDSDVLNKRNGPKEGSVLSAKELQTEGQIFIFDLKEHAASLSQNSLLKETEKEQTEEACTFNLKSAFGIVSTEKESVVKQLQNINGFEEGASLSEELRQSYKAQVEGLSSPEEKLQTETALPVTQILTEAPESARLSADQQWVEKGHLKHEKKISEEEILKMPDDAFIWGQTDPTSLSQYFQNLVEETDVSKDNNTQESIVPRPDSFISDLKKAAQEKMCQNVRKIEEDTHAIDHAIMKERSSTSEGNKIEPLLNTKEMLEEQCPPCQMSSDTSDKELSLAQFLLSLQNESSTSQEGDFSSFTEQVPSAKCHLEKERQYETPELVNLSSGNLNKAGTAEAPLPVLNPEETDFSLTKYLLAAGEQETPDVRDKSPVTREGSITSLEVEDVTFSTVYDYYNQQQELPRPFSPESEMSIDFANTNGDETVESEGFYTPPSSVENFESPMSFDSYHTPIGSPERYSTPSEEPNMDSKISLSELARGNTPPERYQTPTGSPLQVRGSSVDEVRAEMFGTPCEALEPKGNEMPPAFIKPLTKRKLYESSTLRFIAEVIGFPVPDVKWYRNKSLLEQDSRIKVQKEGDICILEIHSIKKTEGGEYVCHAINIIGEAKSITQVEVLPHDGRALALPPPVTHQHVIEFAVEQGAASRTPSPQEILLEVELDENEIKECEKQLKIVTIPELSSDNKSMIVSLDVLPLSLVENVMTLSGKGNEDVKIDFEVTEMPPRFTTPVVDLEVAEKSEALFQCTVTGSPIPVVQWFKESKCIAPDSSKYTVISENGNHCLKIQNAVHSDSGIYLCKAVNAVGESVCRNSLVVTTCQKALAGVGDGGETDGSLDSISNRPQKIDLLVDNTIQNGNQTEIELEFEFERDTDDFQKAVKLVAVTEQEQEEEGESCVNINFDVFAEPSKEEQIEFKAESTDSCSFEFQVTEAPPKFIKCISDCASFIGTSACFQCCVVGSPKPVISWFKNGTLIHGERYCMEESQMGCHSLVIRNLVQNDGGEYKCLANNKAGTAHSTALLTIC